MYGWAGRLKEYFYYQDREFIVLQPIGDKGSYGLLRFIFADGGWQETDRVPALCLRSLLDGEAAAEDSLEKLAGQAALEIARRGWQNIPLLYVLPEEEMLGYVLNLPPNLTVEQRREAAYWEFDDKLLAKGLSVENFVCICRERVGTGGQCTIMGVRRGYLQELDQAFGQAELTLSDILPAAEDSFAEVLSYLNSSQREMAGFMCRSGMGLSVKRVLAVWGGLLILLSSLFLAVDICHYKQAQTLAREQKQELLALNADQQEMILMDNKLKAIADREELLQQLTRYGAPWYSLLVHLGTNTVEGVYLTKVYASSDGQQLNLEGQAVTYDALAEYMGQLEADREFFSQGIRLDNSVLVKESFGGSETVRFSVSVKWESGNDGKNYGKAEGGA